jgi:hypothetical protein
MLSKTKIKDEEMKTAVKNRIARKNHKGGFDPFRIVSDEEYSRNMNSIIAYYQIAKGEGKHRFTSTFESKLSKIALS